MNQMKRILPLALALLFCCAFFAGCAKAPAPSSALLAKKGLELAVRMGELAASEAYVNALSASEGLRTTLADMSAGDYREPLAVYSISLPEDAARALLQGESGGLSDALLAWIGAKAYASIPMQLAGHSGVDVLAASSGASYGESFAAVSLSAPALYLYQYAGDYCVMVCFTPGADQTASATAYFVPSNGAPAAGSAETVAAWLNGQITFVQVAVEQVALP